ncbi:hypothetical protein AAFF_G00273650 [Aldrovandia affinis]|uniref:Uncharacterized protein n=1 Tax=Aldrovandia affinis TaxID=143900 RepID=A0AAD7SSU1_9TELE|nr:hypothetical protein AAFF_G00273650 [Aldrovandia affinis]
MNEDRLSNLDSAARGRIRSYLARSNTERGWGGYLSYNPPRRDRHTLLNRRGDAARRPSLAASVSAPSAKRNARKLAHQKRRRDSLPLSSLRQITGGAPSHDGDSAAVPPSPQTAAVSARGDAPFPTGLPDFGETFPARQRQPSKK